MLTCDCVQAEPRAFIRHAWTAEHPEIRELMRAAYGQYARVAGAPAFAFHTSEFMTTAVALYQRMGYRRAPEFDLDANAHYRIAATRPWTAVAYLKCLSARPAADAA
jgi:ribosomal protein S18 acetylase RimI-like enzyme